MGGKKDITKKTLSTQEKLEQLSEPDLDNAIEHIDQVFTAEQERLNQRKKAPKTAKPAKGNPK